MSVYAAKYRESLIHAFTQLGCTVRNHKPYLTIIDPSGRSYTIKAICPSHCYGNHQLELQHNGRSYTTNLEAERKTHDLCYAMDIFFPECYFTKKLADKTSVINALILQFADLGLAVGHEFNTIKISLSSGRWYADMEITLHVIPEKDGYALSMSSHEKARDVGFGARTLAQLEATPNDFKTLLKEMCIHSQWLDSVVNGPHFKTFIDRPITIGNDGRAYHGNLLDAKIENVVSVRGSKMVQTDVARPGTDAYCEVSVRLSAGYNEEMDIVTNGTEWSRIMNGGRSNEHVIVPPNDLDLTLVDMELIGKAIELYMADKEDEEKKS